MTDISDTKQLTISSAHRKILVPCCQTTDHLLSQCPVMEHNGRTIRIVPHDVSHARLLRSLGYNVPAPVNKYYNWAGAIERGEPPFASQRVTCDLLTMNTRAYVLNDMGTGKTKAALWAWDALYESGQAGKLLVVAKLSTLVFTWQAEVFKTIPHRKCVVLHGTKVQRLKQLADPEAEIFIINHDGIKVLYEELYNRVDIDTVCIDELAAFRNPSDRMKCLRALAEAKNRVWGMTGSPMPNEPTDVWCQAKIVTPDTVPRFRGHFRDMVMTRINADVPGAPAMYAPKPNANDIAYTALQPAVRFALSDVTELPETIYRTVGVELSDQQKDIYTKLMKELCGMVAAKQIDAANAAVAMGKLLQIAGGWVYATDKSVVKLDASKRVAALIDLIESAAHKVLVLAPYSHMIEGLNEALMNAGVDLVTIPKDPGKRAAVFNAFQNTGKHKVLTSHPGRLSHGVTLTAADTAIWYLPITSYETYEQTNARIIRVGQKHKQSIIHMRGTKVETKVYNVLARRGRAQDEFLAMFEEGV